MMRLGRRATLLVAFSSTLLEAELHLDGVRTK